VAVMGMAARHRRGPAPDWLPPIPVRHSGLPRLALYESWHRLRRPLIEALTGATDVIHATTLAMPPRSAPLVISINDLAWRASPEMFTRRGVRFFERGLELAQRDADLVVCPSEATRRDLLAAGFASRALRTVPWGVRASPVSPDAVERVRRRYELGRPYILWIGTIEPRKNLPRLLHAHRRLSASIDLVLAGPRGWNEDLDGLVRRAGAGVRVLGFLPRGELAPLSAGAEVFCFPSLMEGFGLPVLEAMAQGTAVVTSRGTSTEELADGAGVLVDPRDPSSIADGLERVLADRELRLQLAEAGRRRAGAYSWARSAEQMVSVYREVAGRRPRQQDDQE
jgi:glycosyltransferase involved in cell wall biosynthesis